jgi:predicted MFS family arabinose efflux permease
LLLICSALNVVGCVLTAWAPNFAVLLAARSLVGLATTAIATAVFSLLGDFCAPEHRGRASMLVIVGQSLGGSAAFALGGVLLALWSWQEVMLCMSAPLVLVVLLMLALREPARSDVEVPDPSMRESVGELTRYRAVIAPLILGFSLTKITLTAAVVWAAPLLSRGYALSSGHIGAVMAIVMLMSSVTGSVLGGTIADACQRTLGPRRTVSALVVLSALSLPAGLFSIVPGVMASSVLLFTLLTIVVAVLVAGIAVFTIVIPNELRGRCIATLAAAEMLFGIGFAPLAVSVVSNALGGPAMLGQSLAIVCTTSSLLAIAAFLLSRKHLPR